MLSGFLIERKEYKKALKICEQGSSSSLLRDNGKYLPDFAFNKALCFYNLGLNDDCERFFTLSYFGYALMRKKDKAEKVRTDAERVCSVFINTYGVETLEDNDYIFAPFTYGKQPKDCKSIGGLIEKLREKLGMTRNELCYGICTESSLAKIEKAHEKDYKGRGIKRPKFYILEALMQRLGRDINRYFYTFLSTQSFNEKQMRNEINRLLEIFRYDEAKKLLDELETRKDYLKGVNRQFILSSRASVILKKEKDTQKYIDTIKEALAMTIENFSEDRISKYYLSYNEILLIYKLALYYANNNDVSHAVDILKRLRDNMNNNIIDEREKIRTYPLILYNYSKYLGIAENHQEALNIVAEGELLALKHGCLDSMVGFMINKGYNLYKLGSIDKAIKYSFLAYYGSVLICNKEDQKNVKDFAKKDLGINLL